MSWHGVYDAGRNNNQPMKILITGCSGFVGRYLIERLLAREPDVLLHGVDAATPPWGLPDTVAFRQLDLLDDDAVGRLVEEVRPDRVVHLASCSSVQYSWKHPVDSFKNNTNIFLNLLDALRTHVPTCRVLSVGSSEEYGVVRPEDIPLREEQPLRPASPYAAARVAQEDLSRVYAEGFGMDIVCTRSFNHVGAGQSDRFVVSAIGRRFVEFMLGRRTAVTTGDAGVIRDFLDVRDVVRAYHVLLQQGVAGGTYNICSGLGHSIGDIVSMYMEVTGIRPPIEVDESLRRPIENRIVVGSFARLNALSGWTPQISLQDSLRSIIDYWQGQLA